MNWCERVGFKFDMMRARSINVELRVLTLGVADVHDVRNLIVEGVAEE